MIADSLKPLATPIGQLRPLEGNPRRGDVAAVKRSLRRFGQRKPVVAKLDGTVIAGNHMLAAAVELGWSELAVTWVQDDEATAKAYALADNRTAELGSFDLGDLAAMMAEVNAVDPGLLEAASYSSEDLNRLVAGAAVPTKLTDPDEVPEPPSEPICRQGDLWLLGPHRLVCGDTREAEVLMALLEGELVDCVWTDPPWGVGYQMDMDDPDYASHRRQDGKIVVNDDLTEEELREFLRVSLGMALDSCRPGASWYVASPGGPQHLDYALVLRELGITRETIIWVKDQFAFGRQDYHWRHEPIFYGWKPDGPHTWHGGRSQDTVWEIPRPRRSEEHPTMKPVALVARALENSTDPAGLVLDPFAGSGSTLIACHDTGRVARLMDVDPACCDVICRRYQEHTGTKPILERTGEPHDFTG